MQIDKNKLKYIKPLNWKDVFEIWRKNESYENKWEAHYKGRGFNSWEEWRKTYTEPLGLDELSWSLFEIKNPLKIIPEFRGGPFHSWSKYFYLGESHPTFRTLIEHPGI
ncbi:hypothetical protein KJ885_05940, partial [Patescibacteria group bacterium]|nr:hypothetical protein [Patescibacteria group bacterium]